jgi:hypothetical protein
MTVRESVWPPLDQTKREIRLLRLDPGKRRIASFEIRSLDQHPRYDAISHAWGPPAETTIYSIGGRPHLIPRTLAVGLETLSQSRGSTLFWVDALW